MKATHRRGYRGAVGAVIAGVLPGLVLTVPVLTAAAPALAGAGDGTCTAGAHTLGRPGDHMYPDTGNGGYTSVHTDIDLVYDAKANRFLPGNHVVLHDRATQCLTGFSLDFERRSTAHTALGPDLKVSSVTVNGRPATFTFVQPTYPGDPHGPADPDPAAHEASQLSPVGGPQHNLLPPACSPELRSTRPAQQNSQNGEQCPANKLVVTPSAPLAKGAAFAVTVQYTGRPGVHTDGDGSFEGWFPGQPAGDGGFVATEPVGTEDWMPLNDFPTAKPTYDFFDTVAVGKTVLANGILKSRTRHAPDAAFPRGSVTWHWHAAEPVASYLVEDTIGSYHLTERTAANGLKFYEAQADSISPVFRQSNTKVMNQQAQITQYEAAITGPYPFSSDGVFVASPRITFGEEMETMIAFGGGFIDADLLYHENMHQWWGDNVSEASYSLTFFKEGLATLSEYLFDARRAQTKAGGPGTRAGRAAFQRSLVKGFNDSYRAKGSFWVLAPSNPTPFTRLSVDPTYVRPGIAYIALRQILDPARFGHALRSIQRRYGGRSITEAQLEAGFRAWLPNHSAACGARLTQFFHQWFDTAYPRGGGTHRPQITGPGLSGPDFYGAGGCTR